MRNSKIKLPSLRPVTPMRIKKDRGEHLRQNARPNTDYDVNRTIFQDVRPKDADEIKKKKKVIPKTLDPLSIDTTKESKIAKKPKRSISPQKSPENVIDEVQKPDSNPKDTEEIQFPQRPEIRQIETLMERIPTANTEVSIDVISKITPVLDRVLCVVDSFSCTNYINDPVIIELFERLFALIDVDDFLNRIIICRILLMFVVDENSPLILPISKIFYKLSCDQSNDDYFVEENLDSVLISILKMNNFDASLLAAGTVYNLANFQPMRDKMCEKDDLFAFIFDTFNDKANMFYQNAEMKVQLLGIVRRMCKSEVFKIKILESNFLSLAFADEHVHFDVLKTLFKIGLLTDEGKEDFIEWILEIDVNDEIQPLIIKTLPIICNGMEKKTNCGKLLMKFLIRSMNDQESLNIVLPLLNESCQNEEIFNLCIEKSSIFIELVESTELDTNLRMQAYKILEKFPQDKFGPYQKDYMFLHAMNNS